MRLVVLREVIGQQFCTLVIEPLREQLLTERREMITIPPEKAVVRVPVQVILRLDHGDAIRLRDLANELLANCGCGPIGSRGRRRR